MQNLFEPLLKLLKPEKIDTDNLVFRFHYKVICIKESKNLNPIFLIGHTSSLHSLLGYADQ